MSLVQLYFYRLCQQSDDLPFWKGDARPSTLHGGDSQNQNPSNTLSSVWRTLHVWSHRKWRSKSNITAWSIIKLLPCTQDNTRRDNNPVPPAQIAPAHKTPVCQVPERPNVKDIDKVRDISLLCSFIVNLWN